MIPTSASPAGPRRHSGGSRLPQTHGRVQQQQKLEIHSLGRRGERQLHQRTPIHRIRHLQHLESHGPGFALDARSSRQILRTAGQRQHADLLWGTFCARSSAQGRDHLNRQREAFYSAEALRVFTRDATPEGHFEAVLDDIHAIIVEVACGRHSSALDRLQAVLVTVGQVVLTTTQHLELPHESHLAVVGNTVRHAGASPDLLDGLE
ncbi:ABC-three component system protein [Streptomyces gardneri]